MVTRVFLCESLEEINEEIKVAKETISKGFIHCSIAKCGVDSIKVGDYAYFKTQNNSGKGFYAYGKIIAVDNKLHRRESISFIITYEWYSVADYKKRLTTKSLSKNSKFINRYFQYPSSGCSLKKDADLLNIYWKDHILKHSRLGHAVDIFKIVRQEEHPKLDRIFYHKQISNYYQVREVEPEISNIITSEVNATNNINTSYTKDVITSNNNKEEALDKNEETPIVTNQNFTEEDRTIEAAQKQLEANGYFKPKDTDEAEKQIRVSIAQRRGQPEFRESLLKAYNYCCAITGCDAKDALEAAHIIPYCETENNHPSNGLLLRADLHTLFDRNLIAINPETRMVHLHPRLRHTSYEELEGKILPLPEDSAYSPNNEALKWRWEQCLRYRLT